MSDLTWINLLKVKASYGVQGNDNILNDYAYVDQYSLSNDNDNQSLVLGYKANKDLTWESSHNFNIGIDFELFDHRLNGTVEYFIGRQRICYTISPFLLRWVLSCSYEYGVCS